MRGSGGPPGKPGRKPADCPRRGGMGRAWSLDMALAGTDTGLGIDPHRVKLYLYPGYACVSILNA